MYDSRVAQAMGDYNEDRDYSEFADPGGRSSLRAGRKTHACPDCGAKNRLTAKDKALGYRCNACADRAEGRYTGGDY